jgi:hypothetical protein
VDVAGLLAHPYLISPWRGRVLWVPSFVELIVIVSVIVVVMLKKMFKV